MADLDRAIQIAVVAHYGQKDRYGAPYILHPIRVMMRVNQENEKKVAILHDVVEDSEWTLEMLAAEGFSRKIVNAVDAISKREGEIYEDYIERAAVNAIARIVKLADLEDNMDLKRIDVFQKQDRDRFARYHKAWLRLKENEKK